MFSNKMNERKYKNYMLYIDTVSSVVETYRLI